MVAQPTAPGGGNEPSDLLVARRTTDRDVRRLGGEPV